jgi:hypothetical protein
MTSPTVTRRAILAGGAFAAWSQSMAVSADPAQFLKPTRHLDFGSGRVQTAIKSAIAGATTHEAKALSIFSYVRDRVPFGFAAGFWDQSASDVLRHGRGYCNTKSTLFVAMLRGAGVPARQVFVDIHTSVLDGVLSPGTPYVDHSYAEVFLAGRWCATDAYIIDAALFPTAQERARREGRVMGYGVHVTGTNAWNGFDPSFSQYNVIDPRPLGTRNWGVFEDVGDFYARTPEAWNRLNPLLRASVGAFTRGANAALDAMRAG